MSIETQEIVRICEALPSAKRDEVADFARFLLSLQEDEKWERALSDNKQRAKLDSFLKDSAQEGESELDLERL